MSDGFYDFYGQSDGKKISGEIEVKRGSFNGENDDYKYSGTFSVVNKTLDLEVRYKNKQTDTEGEFQNKVHYESDDQIVFDAEIEGILFSLKLMKAGK